ncbi:tetratricopeptide repeat protein [Microcoleus sp. FACHB-831]|uniref:tetratricopeptide repeat protein n=1 Tax=Microcoleus sp. FACHB-831 TaxID=2692827 RepID=UPI00168247A5|nr:tetratricopeptide repeat protein [Microcoleus sp. FACHB-831]MBD1924416.1 tetratricopeptide repeat protein [Microcoleus sp. FACHB-831]
MNRIQSSIAILVIATALATAACSPQTQQTVVKEQMSAKQLNNQGVDKLDQKDYKGAIADFSQALSLEPQNAKAYFNRGFAYYNLENYQKAIEDYTKAIEINPVDAEAFYNRGLAYSNLDSDRAAIQDFEKAGQLYQQQGQLDGYKDAQERIKELKQLPSAK